MESPREREYVVCGLHRPEAQTPAVSDAVLIEISAVTESVESHPHVGSVGDGECRFGARAQQG